MTRGVSKSRPTITSSLVTVKYFQRGVECHNCQSAVSLMASSGFYEVIRNQVNWVWKTRPAGRSCCMYMSSFMGDIWLYSKIAYVSFSSLTRLGFTLNVTWNETADWPMMTTFDTSLNVGWDFDTRVTRLFQCGTYIESDKALCRTSLATTDLD